MDSALSTVINQTQLQANELIETAEEFTEMIIDYFDDYDPPEFNTTQLFDEFLDHCTAHGGNWEGMLLSGLKKLRPKVWNAIPDKMGPFSWILICGTIKLCGVFPSDKENNT